MNATRNAISRVLTGILLLAAASLGAPAASAQESAAATAQESTAATAQDSTAATAQDSAGQTIAPARIGILNSQRLMTESIAGQEAMTKLKQLADSKQAEGQAMQASVEDLRRQINEGRLSLSEEKLSDLEKTMESQIVALRRFGDDAERELERGRQEALGGIEKQLMPLIQEVGNDLGLTYIFDQQGSGLLFADEGTDITEIVLKRFDEVLAAAGN